MEQLKSVETLESYIEELGDEIQHVKKASTFLQEIESQQVLVKEQLERVKQTNESLKEIQSQFIAKTNEFELDLKENQERFEELNSNMSTSFTESEYYLKNQTQSIRQDLSRNRKVITDLTSKTEQLEQQTVSIFSLLTTVNNSILDS